MYLEHVDYLSQRAVLFPVQKVSAEEVSQTLGQTILSWRGVPDTRRFLISSLSLQSKPVQTCQFSLLK